MLADFSRQPLQKACRQQGVSIGCLKKSRQIGHLKSSSAISTVVETASHRGLFFFESSLASSSIFSDIFYNKYRRSYLCPDSFSHQSFWAALVELNLLSRSPKSEGLKQMICVKTLSMRSKCQILNQNRKQRLIVLFQNRTFAEK